MEVKIVELEEDSDYVDFSASSISSHRETADKLTEIRVEILSNLNSVVTLTELTAHTS